MKQFLYCWCILLLFACQSKPTNEFKEITSGVSYKLLEFGEGRTPKKGEVLKLNFSILTEEGDSLYYVPDYSYFLPLLDHELDSIWTKFKIGDKLILKLPRKLFNDYLKLFKVMQKETGFISLHVKLEEVYDSTQAAVEKQKMLSKRELTEQQALSEYLKTTKDSLEDLGGVYRFITVKAVGNEIKSGSKVSIHYRGRFLNGFVFDDTYEKSVTPSFTYGQEYQMINGLHTALKGMKEGESVKIILPSRHAFGEDGSLAGIVPPYTAVIYEVNIIKVIN